MDWREISGNWIITPSHPTAVVHFLGGAFVAAAPHVTYRLLLEFLADNGYAVIATPFLNSFDHEAIARQVLWSFENGMDYLHDRVMRRRYVPIYGLGHSMGCKLHLLIGSLFPEEERAGNILMAFNNYPARRSIPLWEQFTQVAPGMDVEFVPSPEETNQLIAKHYQVRRNLLIKFTKDDIDQTRSLSDVLHDRFPEMTTVKILKGNHLTPLGQEMQWQVGTHFSPLDALGQFVKQEIYRDVNQLKQSILHWLDPLAIAE
jgi:hypothetical protein